MKKSYFIPIILTLFIHPSRLAATPPDRRRLLMDFNWRFSQTDTVGAEQAAFTDSRWRTVNLPHDWSIEGEFAENAATGGGGGYLPTGIGWYRKHFVLPASTKTKNVRIEFDGVYMNSDVWINGHHLGHYPSGYLSFYYDLTSFLKKGENILTVRVNNSRQPNSRWYSGSGIYRHVWLTISNPLHIAPWGTFITTSSISSTSSKMIVKTRINNKNNVSKRATLRSIVLDTKNNEVARVESDFTLSKDTTSEAEQQIEIPSPTLWSPETPYLYTLSSVILDKKGTLDEVTTSFGIRSIEFNADKGFLLNGKHVKMNGVCLHHDAGSVGAAVPEAIWTRRLQVLKDMGCNAIRTSHNPAAPEFLGLCDRMGFLVMDEAFDEWTSAKVKYGYSNYFDSWSQHDLINFIRRDRNHPCIVVWSAGNEIGEQKMANGSEILKPLMETFHKEDPTRPVTTGNDNIAADNGSARLPFLQELDVVGYNYVDRWHERRELYYSIDRHDHPDWRMIGTESVSIPGVRGSYFGGNFMGIDSTVIRPAIMPAVIRAEQLWKFVSTHDYVIGDFMWTGIDYLGESRWPGKNSSSGVIDLCGFPKDAYYFYQSQWTKKPMIHLFPHWNWKGREGEVIPVVAFTNCETVELFLNGKSFGVKSLEFPRPGNSGEWNKYDQPPANITTGDLHLSWDVPFEPGILKAVGKRAGEVVCEEEIRTTGMPASIRLSADRHSISADGQDVAQIKIEVIDENGYVVPNANNLIQFNVEGIGKLIGLDNGNPRDHTSMKSNSRKIFNGLALGIVQSLDQPGIIRIKVTSQGLKDGTLEISAQKNAGGSKNSGSSETVEDLRSN